MAEKNLPVLTTHSASVTGQGQQEPGQAPQDIVGILRARALETPQAQAYVYLQDGEEIGTTYTYAGLDERARAIAAGLQAQGQPGDRVLLLYPAGPEFIPAFFGCLYAGMVAVPAYLPKQNKHRARLDAILDDAGARLVLTDIASLPLLQNHQGDQGPLSRATCLASETLGPAQQWQPVSLGSQKLAFLQYTSGSTGKPKGVMVTHGNVLHNQGLMQKAFGLGPGSVMVSWLPTFHDMGLILGMLQPVYGGFLGVLMPPNAFLQKPSRWLRAISRFGGTSTAGPNFAYELCLEKISDEEMQGLDLSRWTSAVNGAEPLRWSTLERFSKRFAPAGFRPQAFVPAYGMAEGTLYISGGTHGAGTEPLWLRSDALEGLQVLPVTALAQGAKALVPCGYPLGQRVRVVNPQSLQRVQPGGIGEIWVQGPSVAAGYWSQEEATLQAFGATLSGEDGVFLRTGDLGFMHDGQVVVSGRLKDLIVIRGVNYFPHDIEETMQKACLDLRAGCGAAFSVDEDGEEKLVLVQELLRHPQHPLPEVVELVRRGVMEEQGLPVWAVVLVRPGSIPKTSSGKIQRRGCRHAFLQGVLDVTHAWTAVLQTKAALEQESPSAETAPSAFEGLCLHLRELGLAPVSGLNPDTSLLSLGMDSLQTAELQAWLKQALGVDLPLTHFYQAGPLSSLLGLSPEKLEKKPVAAPSESAITAPMTALQESFYLARQSGEAACFIQVEIELPLGASLQDWQGRLDALSRRHQALRLGARSEKGALQLASAAHVPAPELGQVLLPPVNDPRHAPRRQAVLKDLQALASDPQWQSPYSALFLESPGSPAHLVLFFDHLYVDGLSMLGLLADLQAPLGLPEPISYGEGLRRLHENLDASQVAKDRHYWMKRLRDVEPQSELPPGFAGEAHAGSDTYFQALSPALCQALEKVARAEGVTVFALYVAAFAKLWSFWLRQDQLVLNTPVSGRPAGAPNARPWVGCYADILPVLLKDASSLSLASLAQAAQGALLEVQTHAAVSGVDLARELAKERGLRPQALSKLTITSGLFIDWDGALPVKEVRSGAPSTWVDLSVFKKGAGAVLAWNYDAAAIAPRRLQRLAQQMETLLDLTAAGSQADPFAALLSAEDLNLHAALNANLRAPGAPQDLVSLFRHAVRHYPDQVALTDGQRQWTYGQLDRASEGVAWRLRDLQVGPGSLVALCLDRSAEAVLGILGILKAGGAYLPLDPVYPEARLNFMLEDARPAALITQESLASRFHNLDLPQLSLADAWTEQDLAPLQVQTELKPQDPAYVIYTSGSTGKPKGVVVRHAEVARLMSATDAWYGFSAADVWTLFHSYAFDFSVWELWGALLYGARLVVVPAELSRNPAEFYDLCRREGVTVLNQTPSAFYALVAAEAGRPLDQTLDSLRWVIFGGEALDLGALRAWYQRHPEESPRLVNMYGITETTVHVTYRPLSAADAELNQGSLIGVPIPDLSLHVLDSRLRPVPVGVAGELFVGGAGLAQGYLNRPELTEERFIQAPQGRLYRSGDLARFLPSGELDYVGRGDQQVKIRGFRVELGEITEKIRALPGIGDVAVLAMEAGPGDKRLVAYLVPVPGENPADMATVRGRLAAVLPDYMVPAAFMSLDSLPLTENGKLDRRALPLPVWGRAQQRREASTALEASLLKLWKSLLGVEDAGVEDDLFAAGGHSLLAARLLAQAGADHHCRLSLGQFMQAPTVRSLAATIEASLAQAAAMPGQEAEAQQVAGPAEQSLWLLQQDQPQSSSMNVAWAVWRETLIQAGDLRALQEAMDKVLERHAALRTSFTFKEGRLLRQTEAHCQAPLATLAPAPGKQEGLSAATQWASEPFDLAQAPLLRVAVVDTPSGHWVAFCAHHIIFDLRSLEIVMQDLAAAWGASTSLPPAPDGFLPRLSAAEAERLGLAWDAQLQGYDGLPPFAAEKSLGSNAQRYERILGQAWPADLKRVAAEMAVSPFQVLLCAWQLTLLKASGRRDICVGSPITQRSSLAEQEAVGYYANMLPLRLTLQGGESFQQALAASQDSARQALSNAALPLASLIQRCRPPRLAGRHPLFQCALVVQEEPQGPLALGPFASSIVELPSAQAKLDLALVVRMGQSLHLCLDQAQGLLSVERSQALLQSFEDTLQQVLHQPQACWDAAPKTSPGRNLAPGPSKTVVQLFADQVHADHSLPALRVRGGQTVTYGALAEKVRAVAGCLAARGVRPGDAVGVYSSASPQWVAAALGVMECSAVYVPLDPSYPKERLRRMARSAGVKVVLCEKPWPEVKSDPLAAACVALDEACLWSPPLLRVPHSPDADCPAYIIFTSGSSGEPKGVLVRHGALANHAQAYAKALSLGPDDTVMQFVPISFDASLEELFPTLCSGACLALPQPDQALSAVEATEALAELQVTVAHLPAAYWHAWAPSLDAECRRTLPRLRCLVTGGEAPDPGVLRRFLKQMDPIHYFNAYGPTEAAITCLLWHRQPLESVPDLVPLGLPLAGVQLRLVGEDREDVGPGQAGELWIGGQGLAQGYWGDPALTRERFITLGQGQDQRRYYRSGDLVRTLADGSLVYAGRRDDQVKISGYRVELGEIESSLRSLAGVADGAARLEKSAGQAQVWAWVVPQAHENLDLNELRALLAKSLPAALVPSQLWQVDSLPRTPNGKLDRKALQRGSQPALVSNGAEAGPAEALVALWRQNLARPEADIDTDFFGSGGTSLMAVKLAAELSRSTGKRVTLDALYAAPTPRQLQSWLGGDQGAGSGALACLRKEFGGFPLLWLHPVGGQIACYRQLTEALAGAGPVYAIQAEELKPTEAPSLQSLAERYADHLERAALEGPWVLAGWSMGGLLACELSHVLKRRGRNVGLLALIDTVLPDPVEGALLEADEGLCRCLFDQDLRSQGLDPAQAQSLYPAFRTLALALHSFKPRVLHTPLALMLSEATRRDAKRDPLGDWARLAGEGLTLKVLPGDHYSVMRGPAAALAAEFISAQARKAWAFAPKATGQSTEALT